MCAYLWGNVYIYLCVGAGGGCVCVYVMCVQIYETMEGKKSLWTPEQPLGWGGLQPAWLLALKITYLISACLNTCKSKSYWSAASLPQKVLLVERVSGKRENPRCKTLKNRPRGFPLHDACKRKATAEKRSSIMHPIWSDKEKSLPNKWAYVTHELDLK